MSTPCVFCKGSWCLCLLNQRPPLTKSPSSYPVHVHELTSSGAATTAINSAEDLHQIYISGLPVTIVGTFSKLCQACLGIAKEPLLGFDLQGDIKSYRGRIDLIMSAPSHIYIIDFVELASTWEAKAIHPTIEANIGKHFDY